MAHPLRSNPIELDFEVIERITAGLKLSGVQTKAIATNQYDVRGARGALTSAGFVIVGMQFNSCTETIPALLNKKEINRFSGLMTQKGFTIMVESVVHIRGKFKVVLAVCKGKTKADKREDVKNADIDKRLRRVVKSQQIFE